MNLRTAPYAQQVGTWPKTGRHILATFDDDTVVVYQAYQSLRYIIQWKLVRDQLARREAGGGDLLIPVQQVYTPVIPRRRCGSGSTGRSAAVTGTRPRRRPPRPAPRSGRR